jgi:quinol monooxygenase YgiN
MRCPPLAHVLEEHSMLIIIAGTIDLDPERAEQALIDARDFIAASRAEPGCIAYDWAIDPTRPGRINVFEEWESESALAQHFRDVSYRAMRDHLPRYGLVSSSVRKYRCDRAEPVYDSSGTPRADFVAQVA